MRRAALLACTCLMWHAAAFADGTALEAEVEAAVVFNLMAFMQWPVDDNAEGRSLILCSLESGALESSLQRYQTKTVHGLRFAVRRVAGGPDDSRQCDAVFVEAGNSAALSRFAAMAARGQSLLIIAKGAHALDRGAMVGLDMAGGRVAVDVDMAALRRARLTASSKLLRVARSLRD
jgi:hypothetical protein